MQVQRVPLPHAEAQAFDDVIRGTGRDPSAFRAQMFEAGHEQGRAMRRVHVITRHAAVQYDASDGAGWTESFARHLARGFFGS